MLEKGSALDDQAPFSIDGVSFPAARLKITVKEKTARTHDPAMNITRDFLGPSSSDETRFSVLLLEDKELYW